MIELESLTELIASLLFHISGFIVRGWGGGSEYSRCTLTTTVACVVMVYARYHTRTYAANDCHAKSHGNFQGRRVVLLLRSLVGPIRFDQSITAIVARVLTLSPRQRRDGGRTSLGCRCLGCQTHQTSFNNVVLPFLVLCDHGGIAFSAEFSSWLTGGHASEELLNAVGMRTICL